MKEKHLRLRIKHTILLASMSPCPRASFGCVIVDPELNVTLSEGWNGAPRGDSKLCGGAHCERERLQIKSGEQCEVGCYHAEFNAVANASRIGARLEGAWAFVNGEPCLMCAKALHHAGVACVVIIEGGYKGGSKGTEHLKRQGVKVLKYNDTLMC